MSLRIGNGFDSHRFAEGRKLILGGVEIDHDQGLDGHSDADVVAHAITDAILGAAGLGDIGTHYPPTDERWLDANSIDLLTTAVAMVRGSVVNVDATVICEAPRLAEHRTEMESNLSKAVGGPVSVKATTNEGMGFLGRGEGVACLAVALVDVG